MKNVSSGEIPPDIVKDEQKEQVKNRGRELEKAHHSDRMRKIHIYV